MNILIALCWLFIFVGSTVFLAVHGWPWRHRDRVMAWHLTLWVAADIAERLGLLVAGVTLVPAAIVYTGMVGLVYWRLVLLIQTRRRARQDRA